MKLSCPLTFSILSAYCRRRSGLLLHKSESVKQIHGGQNYTPASVVFHTSKPDKETPHISNAPNLPIVHHDGYESYLPPGHRFQMRKFNKLRDVLLHDGVISKKQTAAGCHVTEMSLIVAAPLRRYIEKFFEGKTSAKEQRVTGSYGARDWYQDVLLHDGVISKKQMSSPVHVTKDELIRVHTEEYIEKFFEGKTSAKEQRHIPYLPVRPSVFTLYVHQGKKYSVKKQQGTPAISIDP
eukprot:XP_011677855.1 PREDICTED: uncharacterized protein LOC763056 [Strongylocentrotus purpuratus]